MINASDLTTDSITVASADPADGHPPEKLMHYDSKTDYDNKRTAVVRPGFKVAAAAALIVVAGLAGCSKNTPNADPGSTSTMTSASAPASGTSENTSNPSSTRSSTATSATVAASAGFVGQWHVHGSTLDIAATSATMVVTHGMGQCSLGAHHVCSETDALAVLSGDNAHLTLGVTAVNYTDNTGASVPNPAADSSTAVGDSMQLLLQAPGLLRRTVLHGFPGMSGGNPYWCGPGISQSNLKLCGA